MFGESESESPRVPSPWDLLLSPASVDKVYHRQDELLFSQLAAEVEEGNVEYKLHLINPSPARFARLVTQMKWRLLEGGGQAIYELGVTDSGALVGLAPDDLRATLDTLHAMAAEIGARVVISKEIEVTVTVAAASELGFRALAAEKRHGGRDGRRTAISKNQPSRAAQAFPVVDADSPRSFVSAGSTATSSSVDSTRSLVTDSGSLLPASPPPSPSPPAGAISIPVCKDEMGHGGDDSLVFPMLAEEGAAPADGLLDDGESFIGYTLLGAIPEKSPTGVENGRELRRVQHKVDVGPGSVALTVPAVGASLDRDEELLLVALGKLEIADNPSAPEEHKRTIVEAMVIRELDHEEGFLDFSSF
ncbi:hypothetical protein BJV78DRAFT_1154670 [Lactifluus subvellereus]|nr:hypothetical protein BJV78DRAFT_1154670 [Lactifluus subvellereus]